MSAPREPVPVGLLVVVPAFGVLGVAVAELGVGLTIVVLVLMLIVAVTLKTTLFSSHRVTRMKWRIRCRLRPGPGFATIGEIHLRYSRMAALLKHGRRARPSMKLHHRVTSKTTQYAVRQGRAQYGHRVFTRAEDQGLVLAPPRQGKSGTLGDRVIEHPGPALVTGYVDLCEATAGHRGQLGPVGVINPENAGGITSTFRWAMTAGCEDPAEALRRATDLVGAVANAGDMAWWVEKSAAALAAGMHAAALMGGDMSDVWSWSNGYGYQLIPDAQKVPGASLQLFGALSELERPGKTAESIRLTMSKALAWLAIPALRSMVTGPDAAPFDVANFCDSNGTLYLLAPDGDNAPCAPLFRCFASFVHRSARFHGLAQRHRRLDPGLLFALDELHLCPVDLPSWLADSAGHGIQVVAVVHSTGQLRDKYGQHAADTVWSTAGTKLFLPGIHSAATLEEVSSLCGTIEGGKERVMPPELLAQLPDWRALVLSVNRSPVIVKFRPHWRRLDVRLGRAPALPYLEPAHRPQEISASVTNITTRRPDPELGADGESA